MREHITELTKVKKLLTKIKSGGIIKIMKEEEKLWNRKLGTANTSMDMN